MAVKGNFKSNRTICNTEDIVKKEGMKVCFSILKNEITIKEGLKLLAENFNNAENLYRIWNEIYKDIILFEEEGISHYTDINLNHIDNYVKDVAKQFIQLLEAKLPDNFCDLIWCDSCDHIGETVTAKGSHDPRPNPMDLYDIDTCSKCSSNNFLRLISSFEAREYFLKTKINISNEIP